MVALNSEWFYYPCWAKISHRLGGPHWTDIAAFWSAMDRHIWFTPLWIFSQFRGSNPEPSLLISDQWFSTTNQVPWSSCCAHWTQVCFECALHWTPESDSIFPVSTSMAPGLPSLRVPVLNSYSATQPAASAKQRYFAWDPPFDPIHTGRPDVWKKYFCCNYDGLVWNTAVWIYGDPVAQHLRRERSSTSRCDGPLSASSRDYSF
jgi:hypothetical protein